jgi:hypothetical protein
MEIPLTAGSSLVLAGKITYGPGKGEPILRARFMEARRKRRVLHKGRKGSGGAEVARTGAH